MAYLSGPLTISIQHAGVGSVYERAGPPSIWGSGLVHEDIEGTDDSPVFVGEYTHTGEAQGPVDAPGGFKIGMGAILGLVGVAAIAAAVLMPDKKRSNPRSKKAQAAMKRRRRLNRRRSPRPVLTSAELEDWGKEHDARVLALVEARARKVRARKARARKRRRSA